MPDTSNNRSRSRNLTAEFRSSGIESDGRTLEGYAAVWGVETEIFERGASYTEVIVRGSFSKTARERTGKVLCQYNHGKDPAVGTLPVAVWNEIREDEHGLFVSGRILDTPSGDAVRAAIAAGAINSMSFAFKIVKETWSERGQRISDDQAYRILGQPGRSLKREVREVQLYECGPVAQPAYEATSVGVRGHRSKLITNQAAQNRLRLLDLTGMDQ